MSAGKGVWKNFLVALLLLTYVVVSIAIVGERRSKVRCVAFTARVLDSGEQRFVTSHAVDSVVGGRAIVGRAIDQLDLFAIEDSIRSMPYVRWCDVFGDLSGRITALVRQRVPVLRVMGQNGYDFYVDSTFCILKPDPSYQKNVPIFSGDMMFGFGKNFYGVLDQKNRGKDVEYLKKLINFAEFVAGDDFLHDFVMQIYVDREGEIILVPRIGDQLVLMGGLEDYQRKLIKAKAFYMQCYGTPVLDSVKNVDVRYRGQVIIK